MMYETAVLLFWAQFILGLLWPGIFSVCAFWNCTDRFVRRLYPFDFDIRRFQKNRPAFRLHACSLRLSADFHRRAKYLVFLV